jgi:hypothetical protein
MNDVEGDWRRMMKTTKIMTKRTAAYLPSLLALLIPTLLDIMMKFIVLPFFATHDMQLTNLNGGDEGQMDEKTFARTSGLESRSVRRRWGELGGTVVRSWSLTMRVGGKGG